MSNPIGYNKYGKQAEQQATRFLANKGLKILENNYLAKGGEVDIIARDKDTLVFVEVRFRKHATYGTAEETISHKKQQRVIKAATQYLQQHSLWDRIACRFDTVCLTVDSTQNHGFVINWQPNAFSAG